MPLIICLNNFEFLAFYSIIQLWETGLIKYWLSAYMPNIDKCVIFKHQSLRDEVRAVKALEMFHLSGAFIFLLIGLLMALVAFIMEKIYFLAYN